MDPRGTNALPSGLSVLCVGGRPLNKPQREAALRAAGFQLIWCRSVAECERLQASLPRASVIIGPALPPFDRIALARKLKQLDPPAIVVMLHEGAITNTEQADAVIQANDHNGLAEALVFLLGDR